MSRHTVYDERAGILLGQIIATCYEISTNTKADAFLNYSPHTAEISIYIYPEGWSLSENCFYLTEYGKKKKYAHSIYFCKNYKGADDIGIEPLEKVYEQIEALKKQYMEDANNEKD